MCTYACVFEGGREGGSNGMHGWHSAHFGHVHVCYETGMRVLLRWYVGECV